MISLQQAKSQDLFYTLPHYFPSLLYYPLPDGQQQPSIEVINAGSFV
jgi:hypothetical protein